MTVTTAKESERCRVRAGDEAITRTRSRNRVILVEPSWLIKLAVMGTSTWPVGVLCLLSYCNWRQGYRSRSGLMMLSRLDDAISA